MDLETFAQVIINGILTGGLYSLIAVGLTLIFGVMRVINFVHGETLMIGSYLTYFLFTLYGIDPFISLPLAIFVLFGFGVAIQRFFINPVIDAPHFNQILLTFGLVLIIQNLALILFTGNYLLHDHGLFSDLPENRALAAWTGPPNGFCHRHGPDRPP